MDTIDSEDARSKLMYGCGLCEWLDGHCYRGVSKNLEPRLGLPELLADYGLAVVQPDDVHENVLAHRDADLLELLLDRPLGVLVVLAFDGVAGDVA